jgi:hypothetical protein
VAEGFVMAGGRPKGSFNKRTMAYLRTNGGELPLDYMLKVMRDPEMPVERRDDMAKAAAPFLHAKLQTIQHSGEITTSKVIRSPAVSDTATAWASEHVPPQHTEH